ncbi:cbb3-type cytochrome oxidase assembly protein CcoS [Simiduia litorea]|uniref:cbb3-type cytochrome oxidase assembly protein CcoS n=1 Tax=Simiduia litorea TaxID=1435348 RepID=UPI0036F29473
MEILFLLVPIALIFIGLAIKLLFWAVKNGQYDDLNTEGQRILFDDESKPSTAPKKPE